MLRPNRRHETDPVTWDRCAREYEEGIVMGHPDVLAYENFEEDFLDALLLFLITQGHGPLRLLDAGCGSGRLHLRYGMKMTPESTGGTRGRIAFEPLMASGLAGVDGVDFSVEMLGLARRKLDAADFPPEVRRSLRLRHGSAFDPPPEFVKGLPVAVALCNTIGVMQGPEGARRLFEALRRAVEPEGGVVVISAYRLDAVAAYALSNYESTMNVSGQPCWLQPARFISQDAVPVPLEKKRAFDTGQCIRVAERGADGGLCRECVLERDPAAVAEAVATGHIRTHWDYESRWYSTERMAEWMGELWRGLPVWHVDGRRLDVLRAWPAQLAVLDAGDRLGEFFGRFGVPGGA
ncbi:MAG: class I SAM-dependent methyltransferase [Candidatus Hydrogenedentes bacterium]|nr:class I SAM-dependent methyltransferase [Candidatus Hydrogenedentota bacterium]